MEERDRREDKLGKIKEFKDDWRIGMEKCKRGNSDELIVCKRNWIMIGEWDI